MNLPKKFPKTWEKQHKKYRKLRFKCNAGCSLSCISLRHVQFHWPQVEHDWGRSKAETLLHSRPEDEGGPRGHQRSSQFIRGPCLLEILVVGKIQRTNHERPQFAKKKESLKVETNPFSKEKVRICWVGCPPDSKGFTISTICGSEKTLRCLTSKTLGALRIEIHESRRSKEWVVRFLQVALFEGQKMAEKGCEQKTQLIS